MYMRQRIFFSKRYSPMATAAQMGRIDIVRYLISTGNVNIENVDIGGETPLFKVKSMRSVL